MIEADTRDTAPAVQIENLTKRYRAGRGPEKVALDCVDLTVPRGSIFGLLGPNGAGKSTMINIMAGLVVKTSGRVRLWGLDIDRNPRNARAAIGVVPQELNIDPFFTPREMVDVQAGMYGVPRAERRTDEILEAVGLADKADAYARTLSGGMRRRLLIAKAMVHSPPILVLDEPTAGVDIELRQQLWAQVRRLNAEGVTVLLTTHYLEEAEELCDTIAIINHGKVVAAEPKETMLRRLDRKDLTLVVEEPLQTVPDELRKFGAELAGPDRLTISFRPSQTHVGEILDAARAAKLRLRDLSTVEADLEDIFLELTRGTPGRTDVA